MEDQGKLVGNSNQQKFVEERKENRAMLGQQVVNGAPAAARQESATKRKGGPSGNYGRNTQAAGWANG